jgi:transcriptional regulator of acetoin/glycerol metabolism
MLMMIVEGAAAMSGTTQDNGNRYGGYPTGYELNAEFEADLQCALGNTSPVLITAPADVASAVAARIHRNSVNRKGAFLTVDCGRTQHAEQLEVIFDTAAPRGTVFLRDVDRLAPALQSLLYFRIAPLGVRVIAATSVSLLCASGQGTFDERLFYRLNQIHLMAGQPATPSDAA